MWMGKEIVGASRLFLEYEAMTETKVGLSFEQIVHVIQNEFIEISKERKSPF
jgi:hypothetical protein